MDEIRTARLTLRAPSLSDLEEVHALVSDFEVVKGTASWPYPSDREFTASRSAPLPGELDFGGPVRLGDEIIGLMGIRDSEIGYMFARKHWGKGYATEMASAVIARAFAMSDVPEIGAGFWQDNPASGRVLQKLGFVVEGASRQFSAAQNREVDATDVALTRENWLARTPLRIETDRLVIRDFAPDDTAVFHSFAAQPDVARMMQSIPTPLSLAQALEWIDTRRYRGRLGFCAGVYLRSGVLVGTVGIGGDPVNVAYFFDPNHWGNGYATEAMQGFLSFAFERFGMDQVEAGAMEHNPASQAVLRKLGFDEIGHKLHQSALRVEPDPLILYRLSRTPLEATQ